MASCRSVSCGSLPATWSPVDSIQTQYQAERSPRSFRLICFSARRCRAKGPVRKRVPASRIRYFLAPLSELETEAWMRTYVFERSSEQRSFPARPRRPARAAVDRQVSAARAGLRREDSRSVRQGDDHSRLSRHRIATVWRGDSGHAGLRMRTSLFQFLYNSTL